MGGHAVLAQHDFLDLGGSWAGMVSTTSQVSPISGWVALAAPAATTLGHVGLVAVVDDQLVAGFQKILCHGLAHDAQTDQTDFHNCYLASKFMGVKLCVV